jgi:hypothetical protein
MILDLGCGLGRGLKVFAEIGHVAIGVEGARASPQWGVPTAVCVR